MIDCGAAITAQEFVNHLSYQPIANASGMNHKRVDTESLQKHVDDREAGDDDVSSVGRHSGHAASGPQWHLAKPVEQVTNFGVRNLIARNWDVELLFSSHDQFGKRCECAS